MIDDRPDVADVITVWFSCGAASAVALMKTIEVYGDTCHIRAVNNPVKEEDRDNVRFLTEVQDWLGVAIETAKHRDFPEASAVEVWEKRKFMSAPYGAPCTTILKKEARQQWEARNHSDWHVLGFTAEERHRPEGFRLTERENVLGILVEQGITKEECYQIIRDAGLALPRMYYLGYPNANCIGCVKATSPTYWNHVRKVHPEAFSQRAEQSRRLGARLVRHKGQRIYLDELPSDAKGRPLKSMNIDCGSFCEENLIPSMDSLI